MTCSMSIALAHPKRPKNSRDNTVIRCLKKKGVLQGRDVKQCQSIGFPYLLLLLPIVRKTSRQNCTFKLDNSAISDQVSQSV